MAAAIAPAGLLARRSPGTDLRRGRRRPALAKLKPGKPPGWRALKAAAIGNRWAAAEGGRGQASLSTFREGHCDEAAVFAAAVCSK